MSESDVGGALWGVAVIVWGVLTLVFNKRLARWSSAFQRSVNKDFPILRDDSPFLGVTVWRFVCCFISVGLILMGVGQLSRSL